MDEIYRIRDLLHVMTPALAIYPDVVAANIEVTLGMFGGDVCTTVNNFDHALIVRNGEIVCVEAVSARGREMPVVVPGTS